MSGVQAQGTNAGVPIIQLQQLSVTYSRFRLGPLSAQFNVGARVALVGPNGAGKSTTMRVIAGQFRGFDGAVRFRGDDIRRLIPQVRADIGFVPEVLAGFPWMTAREHLRFLAVFFPRWDAAYADELMVRLKLDAGEKLGALSKGSRVKLSLVAAEAHRPPVLLLDEPTSGLDPVVRHTVMEMIRECAPAGGDRLVLFSTHLLEDVEWLADRVLVLADGRLKADSQIADLRADRPGVSLPEILYRLIAT